MIITNILLLVFGAMLVAAYALWDLGAYHLRASFGRLLICAVTFHRIRVAPDEDEITAMAVSVAVVLVTFVSLLIIASCVH